MMAQSPLMVSISGLRGVVGQSLTPQVALRYAGCFGQWLKGQTHDSKAPHIVVGRDSRPSGNMVESAVVAGLLAVGCRVTTVGILSTPGVAIMTQHLGAQGGVVITASHNPIIWNGLKLLRHDGLAPPAHEAQAIIDLFHSSASLELSDVQRIQPLGRDEAGASIHVQKVLAQVDVQLIRKAKLKVVLDSVHGAGGPETALMLKELGVRTVHLYAEPTGQFPHTPEPLKENLTVLADAIMQHQADAGFAQDPDADRLAVVDELGRYIGEEYSLALTAWHGLERVRQLSPLQTNAPQVVATNLSTSRMVEDIAAQYGAVVKRSPVGEANVAAVMRECGAIIGGEGNGGVILPTVSFIRDSLVGIALILEMLAVRQESLSHIVSQIPAYAIVKDKVAVDQEVVARLEASLKQAWPSVNMDTQDGVRLDWPSQRQWLHVRASNTEPILRLIAEAPTASAAQALVQQAKKALGMP